MASPTRGPPTSITNPKKKKMFYRPIRWRHFLNRGSHFPDNPGLYQVDKQTNRKPPAQCTLGFGDLSLSWTSLSLRPGWLVGTLFSSAWPPIGLGMHETHWAGTWGSRLQRHLPLMTGTFWDPDKPTISYSPMLLVGKASEGQARTLCCEYRDMISRDPGPGF